MNSMPRWAAALALAAVLAGTSGHEARARGDAVNPPEAEEGTCPLDHKDGKQLRALREELLTLTNEVREDEGLRPLHRESRLELAAQRHAEYMAEIGRLTTHGVGLQSNAGKRALQAGYNYKRLWENLAGGQTSAAEAFGDWIYSAQHRANILQPRADHLGIGFAKGRRLYSLSSPAPGCYWVMMIGRWEKRPLSLNPPLGKTEPDKSPIPAQGGLP